MFRWLLIFSVISALGVSVHGCKQQIENRHPMANKTEPNAVELGRTLGLHLSASAIVIGVRQTNGMDDATFAKVELPQKDWSDVLRRAPFKSSDLSPDNRGYLEPDDGFWDPTRPKTLPTAQINLPGARVLNVGVDEFSKPGSVILYIMNHGT